jgi:hypothetical protein
MYTSVLEDDEMRDCVLVRYLAVQLEPSPESLFLANR